MGITAPVEAGTSLLEAASEAGIVLSDLCGGEGICGRCRMIVRGGQVTGEANDLIGEREAEKGTVLACQTFARGDVLVEIPSETRARMRKDVNEDAARFQAEAPALSRRGFDLSPLVSKHHLTLDEPSLDDNIADHQRLVKALQKVLNVKSVHVGVEVIRGLPETLREAQFEITATVGYLDHSVLVVQVEPGHTSGQNYAAVVDIGTSTIVLHLINLFDQTTVDTAACFNSQAVCGREVTARIIAAEKGGADRLREYLVRDVNRLISDVASKNQIGLSQISLVVCSGNTTMQHFLLRLPTANIRRRPFISASVQPPVLRAADLDIEIAPEGLLFSVPGISSWVGGDICAGILATALDEFEGVGMLIDIGTNGEIVLGNREWLVACSASTGPALEGASVACGMVAEKGAIEQVICKGEDFAWTTIGGTEPRGLCGSGIIDLVALLLHNQIIDRAGRFVPDSHHCLVSDKNGIIRFVLVPASETADSTEIWIDQNDLDEVITAKAAVFAAAKILLDRMQLTFSDIDRLFLAGDFGRHIDLDNAMAIGLLPPLPAERIEFAGNTSMQGAKMAAFSSHAVEFLRGIRKRTTYYDLLGNPDYVEQFKQAGFLPHTDLKMFGL